MANGPSKQDLEMYWQSSRQYFDELAKYYQTADPVYYRENIKPFYDNPFGSLYSAQGNKSAGSAKIVAIAVILFVFIGVIAAGFFLFLSKSDSITEKFEELTGDKNVKENTKTFEKEKNVTREDLSPEVDPTELSGEDNFIIGAKYISEKKYDKAAFHLKQIKKGDKRFKEAQQLLESIKYLKKYDK